MERFLVCGNSAARAALHRLSERGFASHSGRLAAQGPSADELDTDLDNPQVEKTIARSDRMLGLLTTSTTPDGLGWVSDGHLRKLASLGDSFLYVTSLVVDPEAAAHGIAQMVVGEAGIAAIDDHPGGVYLHVDWCHANDVIVPAVLEGARQRMERRTSLGVDALEVYRSKQMWVRSDLDTLASASAALATPDPVATAQHPGFRPGLAAAVMDTPGAVELASDGEFVVAAAGTAELCRITGAPHEDGPVAFGFDDAIAAGATTAECLVRIGALTRRLGAHEVTWRSCGIDGAESAGVVIDSQTYLTLKVSYTQAGHGLAVAA